MLTKKFSKIVAEMEFRRKHGLDRSSVLKKPKPTQNRVRLKFSHVNGEIHVEALAA